MRFGLNVDRSKVFARVETFTPYPALMRIAKERTAVILKNALNRDVKLSVLAASCYAQGIEDAAASLKRDPPDCEYIEPSSEMC